MAITLSNKILLFALIFVLVLPPALADSYLQCLDGCDDDFDDCHGDCQEEREECSLSSAVCNSNYNSCMSTCSSDKNSCKSSCGGIDEDSDGVNDASDSLIGDKNNIASSGLSDVYVEAGGFNSTEAGASGLSGLHNVSFKKDGNPIVETKFDFSKGFLDITKATIKKQKKDNRNALIVDGIQSNVTVSKTVYLEKENKDSSLCVADKKIEDVNEITKHCNGPDEYFFNDCRKGQEQNGISCSLEDGMFKVSGLKNSGVTELNYTGLFTGYFTVYYTNRLGNHREGYIMPGESVKLCFETPRSIHDDEYLRLAFVPNNGLVTVNELHTPSAMRLKNVHLYP